MEIMALNCAGPTFTFAGTSYVYGVANTKKIGGKFLADLDVF
jgi:hypothetical protein